MTVPSFSVISNRPRVFFRDTDLAAITARTNDVNGWKTLWDNVIIPAANNYDDDADSDIGGRGDPGRFLVLALAGLVENNSTYRNKAITAAVWLADNNPPNPTNTSGREVLLCLTIVFDLLYDYMSSTQRTTIANEIVYWCSGPVPGEGGMSANNSEWMDGHSGIDQMHQLAGALAIHGFHSQATTLLNESMNFIFGTGPNQGRIEMARYQYAGGGAEKGATFFQLGCRAELGYLYFLKNATTWDSWTAETAWASKIWEWVLWTQWRGSDAQTYEAHGDTGKISNPLFHMELRWIIGMLATQYAGVNGGKYMRWLFDQYVGLDNDFADNQIFDVLFLDRANTTSLAPSTTPPATSKMFFPPGTYMFRGAASGDNAWNYQQSVTARVNARKWYWQGHFHLDSGSVQIVYKGDPLLLSPAGAYELTICSTCHNNNWMQRSVGQSLCPLVLDPSQVYHKGNPSVSTNLSANDGGQHYQKWVNGSGATEFDPNNVFKMQNDAGGQAWLRCESFNEIVNDSAVTFLSANIRNGYRKFITNSQRCPTLRVKYLFIRPTVDNGLTHWAMLYYCRIVKADPDWVTQIPIHTYGAITTTAYGGHWLGYRGVNSLSPAGKLWLDIRNISAYTLTNNTPGTLDANGFGANQFKIGGTGTNYKPTGASSALELQDVKKHSLYVKKTTQISEEHYVMLFMPTASNASEPAATRAWVTDGAQPNHYGITLNGTETYLIHRTLDEVVYPGAAADTTPPGNPTSVVVTPKNTALLTTWTDPVDADLDHIEVWYRTSAT